MSSSNRPSPRRRGRPRHASRRSLGEAGESYARPELESGGEKAFPVNGRENYCSDYRIGTHGRWASRSGSSAPDVGSIYAQPMVPPLTDEEDRLRLENGQNLVAAPYREIAFERGVTSLFHHYESKGQNYKAGQANYPGYQLQWVLENPTMNPVKPNENPRRARPPEPEPPPPQLPVSDTEFRLSVLYANHKSLTLSESLDIIKPKSPYY